MKKIILIAWIVFGFIIGTSLSIGFASYNWYHISDVGLWLSQAAFLFTIIGLIVGLAGIVSPLAQFLSTKKMLEDRKDEWQLQKEIIRRNKFYYLNQEKINNIKLRYLDFLIDSNVKEYSANGTNISNSINGQILSQQKELIHMERKLFQLSTSDDDHIVLKALNTMPNYILGNEILTSTTFTKELSAYLQWLKDEGKFNPERFLESDLQIQRKFKNIMRDHFII